MPVDISRKNPSLSLAVLSNIASKNGYELKNHIATENGNGAKTPCVYGAGCVGGASHLDVVSEALLRRAMNITETAEIPDGSQKDRKTTRGKTCSLEELANHTRCYKSDFNCR